MVVTTSKFASDAGNYANQVNDTRRYYVALLEGEDVKRIAEDRTRIVEILNIKARRTFAKRELGLIDLTDDQLAEVEQPETEDELEAIITQEAIQLTLENNDKPNT